MPLFLITSLYDEGLSPNLFRVVEANSAQEIATHILDHPDAWAYFLFRAFGQEYQSAIDHLTLDGLLERIARTHVDGDSSAQLRITPITVDSLDGMDITPGFQRNALFSDFG